MSEMQGAPAIRDLDAHDALPDAPSVTVLRRFAEDDPDRTIVEIVVRATDASSGAPEIPAPADWAEATTAARGIAARAGLDCLWRIDRTAGLRERAVLEAHGDHSAPGIVLEDDDAEEGRHGGDMRDIGRRTFGDETD